MEKVCFQKGQIMTKKFDLKFYAFALIGAEDKRGQSVTIGYESHSWLYLSGNPVICDRYIEVGAISELIFSKMIIKQCCANENCLFAIVSSINPSLSMTSACLEVAELQQQLLWLLYDMDHLKRYPMAIGCLGKSIFECKREFFA